MLKKGEVFDNKTVEEFLGKPPKWIIRWGITVLFIILSMLFGASYFIPISDEILLPLQSVDNQDSEIIASSEWFVHEFLIASGTNVKKNTPILRISKGFSFQEINRLQQTLEANNSNRNILNKLNILIEKDSTVLSPIDGKLEFEKSIQTKQSVPPGTLLAKIISPEVQLVEVITTVQYYKEVKHLNILHVVTSNGNIIQATVNNINVEGDLVKIQIALGLEVQALTARIRVNKQMLFDKLFKRRSK